MSQKKIVKEPTPYEKLVSSAFIDPIRSVTIIDDAYPTWESWLNGDAVIHEGTVSLSNGAGKTETPAKQIRDIISRFRSMSPALNVDIHDGQETDGVSSYFHQSDLVVLDYELSADAPKERNSLQIAKTLLTQNTHFNLIVMHTSETDLELPFNNVLRALLSPLEWLDEEAVQRGEELAYDVDDYEALMASFGIQEFACAMNLGSAEAVRKAIKDNGRYFQAAQQQLQDAWTDESIEDVAQYLLSSFQQKAGDTLTGEAKPSMLSFSFEALPWIRTSFGFIVFSNKTDHPNPLETLKTALCKWEPTPSRLISAKIRSALEAQGISYEDELLQDPLVGWKQYRQMISLGTDTEALIKSEISRHMENFSDGLAPAVTEFGTEMVNVDRVDDAGETSAFANIYRFTKEDEQTACLQYNCSVSLKPAAGGHLSTGQILCCEERKFLVLTPLCDLVPGRGARASDLKEVSVVELTAVTGDGPVRKALRNATSNHYVFLPDVNGTVAPHHIYKGDVSSNSVPKSRSWFVRNGGVFEVTDGIKSLVTYEIHTGAEGRPEYQEKTYQLFEFQLRYEYALHFLSKIGNKASRIGLDFI
ncbi:response regulator receiver domain [Sulfitobacter sp.]|uniref:response regulator receiver domain n=1 Tax=Sulfitobacter sp. TaxID=1903071 RepID=UPI0039E5BF72